MSRIRGRKPERRQVRIGAPDRALTANAGLAAVSELCGRLGLIGALDAAVGPIKQRDRGFGTGELLTGIAAAQLAGEDCPTGLDRQRADAADQQTSPVQGLASTTAAGLARRITPAQWQAVEVGLAVVTGRMLSEQAAALAEGPVTIDPDTTDVGVYGRKKRGVARNHQGQRVGRPHVATWAEAEIVLVADLGDGTGDPRATAPGLLRRALACLPAAARAGRVALRGDAGYFAGQLARAAHEEKIAFAIGAKRIAPLWRLLAGIADDAWHDAIEMDNAQVAVAEYCPGWWPPNTRPLVRRVLLDPAQVSADPRSRRRRTLHPGQRAPPFPELGDTGAIYAPPPRQASATAGHHANCAPPSSACSATTASASRKSPASSGTPPPHHRNRLPPRTTTRHHHRRRNHGRTLQRKLDPRQPATTSSHKPAPIPGHLAGTPSRTASHGHPAEPAGITQRGHSAATTNYRSPTRCA